MTLLAAGDTILKGAHESTIKQINRKLTEKGVNVILNTRVSEILTTGVKLQNGSVIEGNVPIWATGAEPQKVSAFSDLELQNGYFKVNKFL